MRPAMKSVWTERLIACLAKLAPLWGALVFVALWWAAVSMKVIDPILLPSPADSARALWKGMTGGSLLHDFLRTVTRTLLSFLIAVAIAVPLGIVLGSSDKIYRAVEFIIDFFRSTPASAMFPLFLVLFGVGEKTKIAVAAFGAALVILFNVAYGVMNARKLRQLAARVMGASRVGVLTDVTFWESMPQTFVGMRSGISLALVIVIVAEMFIGSTDGLGQRVINSQMIFDMPEMYASIFAAGALGYCLNLLFLSIERKFVHWGGK
jgi:ABC-type nitrate/sulfonate/bicarbonate transport system permease component